MINCLNFHRSSRNPRPGSPASPTTSCSFKMIRAWYPTAVGKAWVFALYIAEGTQGQRLQARTTDQREIRCERQGNRSDTSVESVGPSTFRVGTRAHPKDHCFKSDHAHHWSPAGWDSARSAPGAQARKPSSAA